MDDIKKVTVGTVHPGPAGGGRSSPSTRRQEAAQEHPPTTVTSIVFILLVINPPKKAKTRTQKTDQSSQGRSQSEASLVRQDQSPQGASRKRGTSHTCTGGSMESWVGLDGFCASVCVCVC